MNQLKACPLCGGHRLYYQFSIDDSRLVRCTDCGLLIMNPHPDDSVLRKREQDFQKFIHDHKMKSDIADLVKQTYLDYLGVLLKSPDCTKLLLIGQAEEFIRMANDFGFEVSNVPLSSLIYDKSNDFVSSEFARPRFYDACVLLDIFEHIKDPPAFLMRIKNSMKQDGVLLLSTPNLNSWYAKRLKTNWPEFKTEHLFYYNKSTLENLLAKSGFRNIEILKDYRYLSFDILEKKLRQYSFTLLARCIRFLNIFLSEQSAHKQRKFSFGDILAVANPGVVRDKKVLSVIMAVYNEVDYIETTLCNVLEKQIDNLDIEIIVVESNSSDGTKEILLKYQNNPRIKLIFEDKPRGKGFAVRIGLANATGDFILIQDADMEYDVEDYDALIEPLLSGRESFVLGARHGGTTWKIRKFNEQVFSGFLLNVGHLFFTFLVNGLFNLRLKDPFTMYKVFRRDCLHGLTFECNRFDFDYELLLKLVIKGYRPVEIPVNYRSRSFAKGKKVSMLRDPFTWIWAIIKLRLFKYKPTMGLDITYIPQHILDRREFFAKKPSIPSDHEK